MSKRVPRRIRRPKSAMLGARCCMCRGAASYVVKRKGYCVICWLLLSKKDREASKE